LKSGRECRSESFEKIVQCSASDLVVKIRMQGIEAEIDGLDSGIAQVEGKRSKEGSIGGEGKGVELGKATDPPGNFGKIWTEEGFAARQADMAYSCSDGLLYDMDQFPCGEMFWTRGPPPVGRRSAIQTALVALIGDRDAQIIDFPAERIPQVGGCRIRWDCGW
jgi:hypothetical protein